MNDLIQYILVILILAGAVAWIIYKLFTKRGRSKGNPCCGCGLSNACQKQEKNRDDCEISKKEPSCCNSSEGLKEEKKCPHCK